MSVKLREMLEKRNHAVTEGRAFIEKAEKEGRNMTEDESRQCDTFLKEAGKLRTSIDREITLQSEERANVEAKLAAADETRGKAKDPETEARSAAFKRLLTLDVSNGDRLSAEEYRSLTAGGDTTGGFLNAPQEFVRQFVARVKDIVFVRGMATVITTTNANGLGFPTLETDADDAEWSTEIKLAPEDKIMALGKRELKPHPLKKLVKISDKLLRADGLDPEAIVIDRSSYKFGITEERAYFIGSGNQQPLGLFTASPQGIDIDRDVSTDMLTNDFTADALKNAKYKVKAQYMSKACWLFHRDAVLKVAKLKDGEGQYLFDTSDKVGEMDSLLGRPLCMSEYVPNTFTTGQYVGMFCDMSWYYIADSLALRIKRLNELFALTSEVGFVFDKETDAMPILSEAFVRIKTA